MSERQTYKRDQICGIINSVLGKIQTPPEGMYNLLTRELEELKISMEEFAAQLHSSNVNDISETHIPNATDELYAVVAATEQATETIMGSCEEILETVKNIDPAIFQKIEACIVTIFEACTFQDITGQRIKKVTNNLKEIDAKTMSILSLLHSKTEGAEDISENKETACLLNGPGLPGNTLSQKDIDQLLSEFDDNNA